MSGKYRYTDERNAQILISLMKAHGVLDVVISPGATNDCFVLSIQDDPDFRLYSAVDERHAGYLACGIAQESGRPVAINCTGATASRNYMSALTEAYYRKLPILAITCSQSASHIGQMFPQMTDRVHLPSDVVNLSVQCPVPRSKEDEWDCEIKVNRALLELYHRGGGPVHINLETGFCKQFTCENLPPSRVIRRIMPFDDVSKWPKIPAEAKVLVWVGSHRPFCDSENTALTAFVASHNAVVVGDLTSNCACAVRPSALCSQAAFYKRGFNRELQPDLIVHIGEISGDYPTYYFLHHRAPVWRVNPDGELRDPLGTLQNVFEMSEERFFRHYHGTGGSEVYRQQWMALMAKLPAAYAELPFSSLWIADRMAPMLPAGANLFLGILNPLRCWNAVGVHVRHAFGTVGGFGIDGGISAMIGSALAAPDVLNVGVFGDLSFFYNLNALGSRHVGNNIRILLVNNGEGGEFSTPGHIADNENCGERVHAYIAARGHYGRQSRSLAKGYAESLGFEYLVADDKVSFADAASRFLACPMERPILFECFTNVSEDRAALKNYANMLKVEAERVSERSLSTFWKAAKDAVMTVAGK